MIRDDPQHALELAVPESARRALPDAVRVLLEEPVGGRGDLLVLAALPAPGEPLGVPANSRQAIIGGLMFEAFTFGRRLGEPSRWAIPLHGIALDGKLALSDQPARILDAVEVADAKAAQAADPICGVSGLPTTANNDEVGLVIGDEIKMFCGSIHALNHNAQLAAAEGALPVGAGSSGALELAEYASTGNRQVILIRVDFSDYTNDPFTRAEGTNIIETLNTAYSLWSYGRLTIDPAGSGSAVTPVYRMPKSNAEYDGDSRELRDDAHAAATADGYNVNAYDFDAICFSSGASGWGYAGLGYIGAKGSWLHTSGESFTASVATHEFGHNFGLGHASYYDAPTGTVIGPGGTREEYGDPFDTMGAASTGNAYSARHKQYLGWLTNGAAGDEWKALSSGSTTNRIYAHDVNQSPGLLKGLRLLRDSSLDDKQYYWVEFRTQDNTWLDNGVGLRWAGSGNQRPQLLDTTPDTVDGKNDSPILIGRTFSDRDYGIHITPIDKGGSSPQWLDVVVRFGQFSNNDPPTVTVTAPDTTASTGQSLSFSAAASDPDGDTLAYAWDYGDGGFSSGNNANVNHSWSANGEYIVRCTVTDMKGGRATDSILVRIGSPSTFRISGTVMLNSAPAEGVRVSVASDTYTYTDSDGTYRLVGLTAGDYTVTARDENGNTLKRDGFSNPVNVGPNQTDIDFIGGLPTIGSIANKSVNLNQSTEAVRFYVNDSESAASALTLDGTSGDANLVTNSGFNFGGSGTNRTVTVTPRANQSGVVTNTISLTDPDGNVVTEAFTFTVNAPPATTSNLVNLAEDNSTSINLWGRVNDDLNADSNILFRVTNALNGTATLQADGHTVLFQPTSNFNGTAEFDFIATDRGYHPQLLFNYDFDGGDSVDDSQVNDRSGRGRPGVLDTAGSGNFTFITNDTPPALALFSRVCLDLEDNGDDSSARLYRHIASYEFDFNDSDWSFSGWFKRASSTSHDFIFHLGRGNGFGGADEQELQLYCPSGSSRVRLRHFNANNALDMDLFTPATVATNQWHHIAVVFNRTNTDIGDFELYLNGVLVDSTNGIAMALNQAYPVVLGGHANDTNNTGYWFDGRLDELGVFRTRLNANQVAQLTTRTVAHFGGLSSTNTITLNVTPVNDPPVLTAISNRALGAGQTLTFTNSATDPEVPATQALAFTLLSGAPAGATVASNTGVFHWRPPIAQGGTTNLIRVRVADNGAPILSATQQFLVTVNPAVVPGLTALGLAAGQFSFQVTGAAGPDYHLWATTNMTDWVTLQTWSNAAVFPLNWTDTNAVQFNRRFYEIRLGP